MDSMETSGIQPTYNLAEHGMDGFGGSGFWIFALLILAFMGNGSMFGGNAARTATVEDLSNQSNFTRLESSVAANGVALERKTDQIINGMSTIGYTMAEKFGETNALVIAENQKTRDLLQQNKIEALQAQISQLQLAQAMQGVVKYPQAITYNGGTSPFCSCGCNGTNI